MFVIGKRRFCVVMEKLDPETRGFVLVPRLRKATTRATFSDAKSRLPNPLPPPVDNWIDS